MHNETNIVLSFDALCDSVAQVLIHAGASEKAAADTAHALVLAEADGIASHGIARVPYYTDQLASGKIRAEAVPIISQKAPGTICVDAGGGFAFPAIRTGLDAGIERTKELGTASVAISNSHHAGVMGHHVEYASLNDLLAIGVTNTPPAMAPWGAKKPLLGTNPIAFACPRKGRPPLVIDLSLTKVARGKIVAAAKQGDTLQEGWAIDSEGRPTTDPSAALDGSLLPVGNAKGFALALMVEILAAGVTASHFSHEATSFFPADGPPPLIGQFFLLIDPLVSAGDIFFERIDSLLNTITAEDGVRLPGERRIHNRTRAMENGIEIPEALYKKLDLMATQ